MTHIIGEACCQVCCETVGRAACDTMPKEVKAALMILGGLALVIAGSVGLGGGFYVSKMVAGCGMILPGALLALLGMSLLSCRSR